MPELTLPENVHTLAARLAEPKPMRRSSVLARRVKRNKPGCPCAENPAARHGPYFSVSRVVRGKTESRWLDAEEAKTVDGRSRQASSSESRSTPTGKLRLAINNRLRGLPRSKI